MKTQWNIVPVVFALTLLAAAVSRADNRSRLYTAPDPSAQGGIKGYVTSPSLPIEEVLALPRDEMSFVYEGTVTGDDRRGFLFEHLPMRKYDLVIIYAGCFYEGLELFDGNSTLTRQDVEKIDQSLQKSEPFFNHKIMHRMEGETGRGNMAKGIVTYLAAKELFGQPRQTPYKRTFKVVLLKDVGPGWQIVKTRDLYPKSVAPSEGKPDHNYTKALSSIRVTDYIKDVGELNLTRPNN